MFQDMLAKMSESGGFSFFRWLLLVALLAIGGFVYYDITQHGSFESKFNKRLRWLDCYKRQLTTASCISVISLYLESDTRQFLEKYGILDMYNKVDGVVTIYVNQAVM